MLNRRGFLAAMLGTLAVPKDVLSGLATPAPIKKAASEYWVMIWRQVGTSYDKAGNEIGAWEVTFSVPDECAHLFKNEKTGGWMAITPTS